MNLLIYALSPTIMREMRFEVQSPKFVKFPLNKEKNCSTSWPAVVIPSYEATTDVKSKVFDSSSPCGC